MNSHSHRSLWSAVPHTSSLIVPLFALAARLLLLRRVHERHGRLAALHQQAARRSLHQVLTLAQVELGEKIFEILVSRSAFASHLEELANLLNFCAHKKRINNKEGRTSNFTGVFL